MKRTTKIKKKGGDLLKPNGKSSDTTVVVRLGRPPREDRDDIVQNNGYTRKQWAWLKREAKAKNMDTMAMVRSIIQWWIDDVEASRSDPVATPEEDREFEQLISKARKSHTSRQR